MNRKVEIKKIGPKISDGTPWYNNVTEVEWNEGLAHLCDYELYSGAFLNRFDPQTEKGVDTVEEYGWPRFIQGPFADAYASANKISKEEAANQLKEKIAKCNPGLNKATEIAKNEATTRLTDVTKYTGTHKQRFDAETGKGKGLEGREDIADDSGYVQGYKNKGTYDSKK
ncbi:hypothetical protein Aperf_G00000100670 [Anoplocephala perfoliata]